MGRENFSAPDPERPLMILRLRSGHEKPAVWERLFPQLVKNKACCDEVWFSTGVGIPPLDHHQKRSALMAKCSEDLRSQGIIPSLQIQATLGHSDDITAAAGADGKSWSSYVGVNGEQCQYINCPRQQGFLDYFRELSRIYAWWRPGSVWIDDDLRLHNHRPAMEPCGCYCPDCLEIFGQEEGRTFTREELIAAYKADPGLYKRWERFGERSLARVAEVIVTAFLEVSPETRFGLQHCMHPMRLPVIEALKKYANARVGSRPGGGAYSDHYAYNIIDKAVLCSMQIRDQQGYETLSQICPEIESCPRSFTCKTSRGHRLESLLYLALGGDSLSFFIMDPALETPEWYGRELLAPLAEETPCYKAYIHHNENTYPCGIGLAASVKAPPTAVETGFALVGTALGGCSPLSCGHLLRAKAAEMLSEEELQKIFAEGCILDGYAAMALQERGLNALMGGVKISELTVSSSEYYTEDPINQGFETRYHSPLSKKRFAFEVPAELECRVLGLYCDNKENKCGIASLIFNSSCGGRCALLGYEGMNIHYLSSDRVRQLNRIADFVAKEQLPVLPVDAVQCLTVPRVTAEKVLRSVTFLNPTIGIQKEQEFILRGVPEEISTVEFLVPAEKAVLLPLHREKGVCKVTLPPLGPWDIGWLKIGN